jgi:hypothetical protein
MHWMFNPFHITSLNNSEDAKYFRNSSTTQKAVTSGYPLVIFALFLRKECWELCDGIAANDDKNEPTGTMF